MGMQVCPGSLPAKSSLPSQSAQRKRYDAFWDMIGRRARSELEPDASSASISTERPWASSYREDWRRRRANPSRFRMQAPGLRSLSQSGVRNSGPIYGAIGARRRIRRRHASLPPLARYVSFDRPVRHRAHGKRGVMLVNTSRGALVDTRAVIDDSEGDSLRSSRRLGDALAARQEAYLESRDSAELLAIYHLLGDPALALR